MDHHKTLTKPDARELDRRNRESGLGQVIRVYAQDPPIENFTGPTVLASFQDGKPSIKAFDGTQLINLSSERISADRGNVSVTLTRGEEEVQLFATNLSANRTVTLPPDGLKNDYFRIVYSPPSNTGYSFNVATPSGVLKTAGAPPVFFEAKHDGTQWWLIGYGPL